MIATMAPRPGEVKRAAKSLRRAQRRFENLRGGIVVRRVKRQPRSHLPLELNLGAVRHAAIQVQIQPVEVRGIGGEHDLVAAWNGLFSILRKETLGNGRILYLLEHISGEACG